ncbi:KH domain-containing protein [Candidatus Pacearchaeota archaeon]|nr:KH domain-containing protein [Candidatus Pacearchaeota archaeon]
MAVIDMRAMRYINLLDKISKVKTRRCFVYNNSILFAVNRTEVSRAIGSSASNIKRIQEHIGRKVRVIKEANGIANAKEFIEDVVAPVSLRSVEVRDGVMVIVAGNTQSKASLIGRDKQRYFELKRIVNDVFDMDLKII